MGQTFREELLALGLLDSPITNDLLDLGDSPFKLLVMERNQIFFLFAPLKPVSYKRKRLKFRPMNEF